MRCAMCGYEFEQSELICHSACPLGAHCMVVCCPRCGYSTVDPARSSLTRRLFHLFQVRNGEFEMQNKGESDSIPHSIPYSIRLLDLKPGQSGHIADAGDGEGEKAVRNGAALAHLSQYGLLPGTPVLLTQKRPVPIVRVGQTELALDHSVAAEIYVDV